MSISAAIFLAFSTISLNFTFLWKPVLKTLTSLMSGCNKMLFILYLSFWGNVHRILENKQTILGYPHFRKPPFALISYPRNGRQKGSLNAIPTANFMWFQRSKRSETTKLWSAQCNACAFNKRVPPLSKMWQKSRGINDSYKPSPPQTSLMSHILSVNLTPRIGNLLPDNRSTADGEKHRCQLRWV